MQGFYEIKREELKTEFLQINIALATHVKEETKDNIILQEAIAKRLCTYQKRLQSNLPNPYIKWSSNRIIKRLQELAWLYGSIPEEEH